MKLFKFLIFLFVTPAILAQTTTQNYVVTTIPFQSVSDPASLTDVNSNTIIQYIDGRGRLSQTVQKAITPNSADLISVSVYSVLGRDSLQWLPAVVASNNGAYYSNYTNYCNQSISSNGGDTKPYIRTEYEPSPLNRVTGQYAPGVDWYTNSKKVSTAYTVNGTDVKYFYVESDLLKCNGTYSRGTLNGVQTTDEDGKTIVEYTDKIGRKILRRVAGNYDTYYVFDDIGNLRYVLPPLAADGLSTNTTGFSESAGSVLDIFAYIYHYDGRKRLVEKKLPGTSYTYMVYDKADRLILSSDGNQYNKNYHQWIVSKYDKFGRLLYTGLIRINSTRSSLEGSYSSSVSNDSYTGTINTGGYSSLILTPSRLLTVNYYDTYTYRTGLSTYSSISATLGNTAQSGYPTPDLTHNKSLTTGVCNYHLDDSTKFELTAIYYDKYGRVVQSRSSNHLAGYDLTYNLVDFIGKPTKTYKTHGISGASTTITEEYSYTFDKAQRLLTTTHKLNGGTTVTLSTNTYDELGRLNSKAIGGSLVSTAYTYNVRSWLTSLTNPKFEENLYYYNNQASLPSFVSCYNGNISGMKWTVTDDNLGYYRAYSFNYDDLNRLTSGTYCGKSGTTTVGGTTGKFDENVTYDKMGNISTLNRKEDGSGLNYLTYTYSGNQLTKVDNSLSPTIPYGSEAFVDRAKITTAYIYDKNGNTVYDANRGISTIRFNLLNLPEVVQFTAGHQNWYGYSAGGSKLSATSYTLNTAITVPQGTITPVPPNPADYMKVVNDYIGNIIYQNSSLKQIQTSEGYCQGGVYFYYLKDHLGNTRYVINSSGTKIETSHYYPFGMRFYIGSTTNSAAIGFRYNGKEFDAMNGLYSYDYGARFYDPQIGRWTTIDPAAELGRRWSPYTYTFDNPIRFLDPDGMWPDDPPGFKKGWNQTVQRYNDNFYSGLQDRIINPKLLLNDLDNAVNGLMNLATDVTGISNIVTGENKTAQALSGAISTLSELPKMTGEERGVIAAGIGIAITEMALTKNMPLGDLKALSKGVTSNAGGYIRSFTTETTENYFRVYTENASGAYLTKVAPKSSAFAREGLALPDANKASFIQNVTVPDGVVLQRSRTLPAWGRRGGLEQFEILNRDSRIVFHPGVPFK